MHNCGLIDILRQMHDGIVPNTHARGPIQIEFDLATLGLSEHLAGVGLLDRSVLQSDHSCLFMDLIIE
jgi:hypothetical protein